MWHSIQQTASPERPDDMAPETIIGSGSREPNPAPREDSLLNAGSAPRRRVRFVDSAREEHRHGVTITVRLEWQDVIHSASATGEKGSALELKTTAQAALDAVEKVCGQSVGFRIIGVKQLQAFDSTLMVASLVRLDDPGQRLVGAVIAGDDRIRSAAVALLSALNRALGNYLHTSD